MQSHPKWIYVEQIQTYLRSKPSDLYTDQGVKPVSSFWVKLLKMTLQIKLFANKIYFVNKIISNVF